MKVIVTGSSGFIGRKLTNYLRTLGYEVHEFDYKKSREMDIRSPEAVESFWDKVQPDYVYHLAAQAFVKNGEQDPLNDLMINGYGMINVLNATKKHGNKLLYTSSGAIYGLTNSFPHKEEALVKPTANYGCTKYLGELYLRKYVMTEGIDAKTIRFSSVHGYGRGREGAVNVFIDQALKGEKITVYGDGSQTRDIVRIDDACKAVLWVMHRGKAGETYNIGSGTETSIKQVADIISWETGTEVVYIPKELSIFDVKRSYYDISKLKALGYKPMRSVKEGIKKTLEEEKNGCEDTNWFKE